MIPLIIDSFAGGGGASEGIRQALGRSPDIAINHDGQAVSMHAVNHPETRHLCRSVYQVDLREEVGARPVGLLWTSPDCTHHSKAKGGQPREHGRRDLANVVVEYAAAINPAVIILENVEEFRLWGPLDWQGRPVKDLAGIDFRRWVTQLRQLGYRVDWRELRACDYGAPTIRKRLFVVARCDGRPIAWPRPSHGAPGCPEVLEGRLRPWRTAADIIDWSEPMCSIFATRDEARAWAAEHGRGVPQRPLADATLRRIAHGVARYVLQAAEPFMVTGNHRAACPTLVQTGYGERDGQAPRVPGLGKPLGTPVAGGQKHALVAAFLATHYGGKVGRALDTPCGTVTTVDHHSMVTANLTNGCGHHAGLVAAFLQKYSGTGGQDQAPAEPLHTVPTRDRFGLVTVALDGQPYVIADIAIRMLTPRELFRAQGFPDTYHTEVECNGKRLSKAAQVRMCGNSVCPDVAAALVSANCAQLVQAREAVTA